MKKNADCQNQNKANWMIAGSTFAKMSFSIFLALISVSSYQATASLSSNSNSDRMVAAYQPNQIDKMDAEIHTVVIQKLELALSKALEDETVSLKPVRSRLADLYAERARLRAMNEAENNCQKCTGAFDDRKRALQLYDQVLIDSVKENRGPLMLQMAQLNELNGNFKKAETLSNAIVNEGAGRHAPGVLAEGLLTRAEARFARGDVDHAQKDFEAALKLVGNGRKGPILHRISWCQLNRGDQVQAVRTLVRVLETPQLLARDSASGATFDESFQEDVARDLATFFARGNVTHREISLLESLTPERARRETMKHFATECDRLGQKKAAIQAWSAEAKYEETSAARVEIMVRVAQINRELGQNAEALQGLRDVVNIWKSKGCDDVEVCKANQNRMRSIIIAWNKSEKKSPSATLIDAYLVYLTAFPTDLEMTQWAAEVARSTKKYAMAATLFHKSAVLASAALASASSASNDKLTRGILESALVGEVEMAELSKDTKTREAAYNHYLELNTNGQINEKIRYQRAHLSYENGQMSEASKRFHELTLSDSCQSKVLKSKKSDEVKKLCVQAADLDLDALVGLKQHELVQARGAEYGRLFANRRNEYIKISRTAVLKQAEGQEPKSAIAKLAEADLTGATSEDRVRFLKTWLSLAEKSKDIAGTRTAATHLLNTKGLSAADRELALGKTAWAAEISLEFNEALQIVNKMQLKNMRPEDRAMKKSLLADLAGLNSRSYDEDFLRHSRDAHQKAVVRVKLIRSAKNSLVEFKKHEKALQTEPSLYSAIALEIYAKTGSVVIAEKALRIKRVAKEPAGQILSREIFIKKFAKLDSLIAHHRILTKNEKATQNSLIDRLQMITLAEKIANQAISNQDWVEQVLALSMVGRESRRLAKDIISLPIPAKLKGKDRVLYTKLIDAKARGYQHKADLVNRKVDLLWGQADAQIALEKDFKTVQNSAVRALLGNELRRLSFVAPVAIRQQLEEVLNTGKTIPSEHQVALARQEAKQSPFSVLSLTKLRDLEVGRGRETMVAYLDARMMKLKSSSSNSGVRR